MRKRAEMRKQAQASMATPQAPEEAPQAPKSPSSGSRTAEENRVKREEIAMLKSQLEEQARLIERLGSKINMDPVEETEQLEKLVQNGVVENITVHA
jgi:hypothetical protein